jgi:hypothetical protein
LGKREKLTLYSLYKQINELDADELPESIKDTPKEKY